MRLDLDNLNNIDESLSGFNAMKVIKRAKVELGVFDKVRPLSEAKNELKNLMDSREDVSEKVMDAIKSDNKTDLAIALKKQRLLNKMIYIVQSEVDYKTQLDFMKSKNVSKSPTEEVSKEIIKDEKEITKELEPEEKDKEELTNLITDIKASTGNVVSKAKSTAKGIWDNPKEYFTTKNVLIATAGAFAVYGIVKYFK